MREEARDMTVDMVDRYKEWQRARAYRKACESRCFIKCKTITAAILAESVLWDEFWKGVRLEWPDTKGASAQTHSGGVIKFRWENSVGVGHE